MFSCNFLGILLDVFNAYMQYISKVVTSVSNYLSYTCLWSMKNKLVAMIKILFKHLLQIVWIDDK